MRASTPFRLLVALLVLLPPISLAAAAAADSAGELSPEAADSDRQGRSCLFGCWVSSLVSYLRPATPVAPEPQAIVVQLATTPFQQQQQQPPIVPVVEVSVPCAGPNCGGLLHCYLDRHCTGGFCRAGKCRPRLPLDSRCSRGSHCLSGFCSRRGVCVACRYSSDCTPWGSTCTAQGRCTGPIGPPPDPSCAAVICLVGQICKEGVCVPAQTRPCTVDFQCYPGEYCRAYGGGCQPKHATGRFCSGHNQCQSGRCLKSPVLARTGRSQPAPLALPFSSRCQ